MNILSDISSRVLPARHVRKWIFIFCLFGIGQFFVLTFVGMWLYPGGTLHDESTIGYSFFRNYFSDLGRYTALNGVENTISAILYQTTLSLVGIEIILFFFTAATLFPSVSGGWMRILLIALGAYTGYQYMQIAVNPVDVDYFDHIYAVRNAFISFLLALAILGVLFLISEGIPRWPAALIFGYCLLMGIQIVLMLYGPRARMSPDAEIMQVTAQKVLVYVQLLVMGAITWALLRINDRTDRGKEQNL